MNLLFSGSKMIGHSAATASEAVDYINCPVFIRNSVSKLKREFNMGILSFSDNKMKIDCL